MEAAGNSLVSCSYALHGRIGELSSLLECTGDLQLEVALLGISTWVQRLRDSAAQLAGVSRSAGEILAVDALLQDAVGPWRVVDSMFRLESAVSNKPMRTIFLQITSRIKQLEQDRQDVVGARFLAVSKARTTLEEASLRLLQASDMLEESLSGSTARNGAAASGPRTLITLADDLINQLASLSIQLSSHSSPGDGRQDLCPAVALLGEQLQEALALNLRLDELVRAVPERIHGSETAGDVQTALSNALTQIADLPGQLSSIGAIAKRLPEEIERLTRQMRLISLNAQLQAAKTGTGGGLEVLAARTASAALRMTGLTSAVYSRLDRLVSASSAASSGVALLSTEGQAYNTSVSRFTSFSVAESAAIQKNVSEKFDAVRTESVCLGANLNGLLTLTRRCELIMNCPHPSAVMCAALSGASNNPVISYESL